MSSSIAIPASSSPGQRGHGYSTLSRRPRIDPTPFTAESLRAVMAVSFLPGTALGMTETFGERLRRLRNERGITVVDLALAVGAAEGTIRQIENGTVKMPSFLLGIRLANQLNVDPQYLALGQGFSISERFDALERRMKKVEQRIASMPAPRR